MRDIGNPMPAFINYINTHVEVSGFHAVDKMYRISTVKTINGSYG
jgi:hypothetical protein